MAKQTKKTQQVGRYPKTSTSTKSAPKLTRDHYRAGPFYIKWKRPDGSIKVTMYKYDPKDRYMKDFTRKAWIKLSRVSGESIGWTYLGLAKKSKREDKPLKFT